MRPVVFREIAVGLLAAVFLLPLLLVVNCVTECVLFAEQFSVGNFAYLLCLGYALERDAALDKA